MRDSGPVGQWTTTKSGYRAGWEIVRDLLGQQECHHHPGSLPCSSERGETAIPELMARTCSAHCAGLAMLDSRAVDVEVNR